jgi:hypothetical protein
MPWFSAVELADSIRRRQVSCVEVMSAYSTGSRRSTRG